jgi:hypothetical protein
MLQKDSKPTNKPGANLLISLHQGLLKVRLTEELLAESPHEHRLSFLLNCHLKAGATIDCAPRS